MGDCQCRVVVIELTARRINAEECLKEVYAGLINDIDIRLGDLPVFSGDTLLVLPENFICCCRNSRDYAENVDVLNAENCLSGLQKLALRHRLYIIAGTVPDKVNGKYYISSYVISKDGEILTRYHKINLFKAIVNNEKYDEGDFFTSGESPVVFTMGNFRVGMAICFDLRFPEHFLKLRRMGADIIVVPAAFTRNTGIKHWKVLLRARAIENQVYVVGAGLCGETSNGYACYGHSMVVDPDGAVLSETAPDVKIQVLISTIDKSFISEIRRNMPIFDD